MSRITERVLCPTCPYKQNGIKEEGTKFGVEYVIHNSKEKFLICDNPDVSWDKIMSNIKSFDTTYVPKFGKYEVEEFVGHFMVEALLISKDITDLLNMDILYEDFPYNTTRASKDIMRERLLKCFDIVKVEGQTTYLKFRWVRYDKL